MLTPAQVYWHLRIACLLGGFSPACLLVLFVAAAMCWYDVLVRVNLWLARRVR